MEIKKHIYTEQEAYLKLSALCASAEYCEYDLRKKTKNWEIIDNGQWAIDNGQLIMDNGQDSPFGGWGASLFSRLRKERFIDDERFARAFVRDKFRYNHWGRVRISQELRMRKIDSSIIEEALTEIPEDDNLETLRHLINNKRKSVKGKSDYEIRCKLIRFALGRGFQMDDIIKVVGDVD